MVGTTLVASLGVQAHLTQQPCDSVLAACLAQVTHVRGELAVAIYAAALQPGLLEQT